MIQDYEIEWPASQRQFVRVNVTLPVGRTFADWDSFVLTIREDPKWNNRSARDKETADPHGESWTVAKQVTGTAETAAVLLFDVDALPAAPGEQRYAFDVRGIGGVAGGSATGETELFPTTWLTIGPKAK